MIAGASQCKQKYLAIEIAAIQTKSACADSIEPAEAGLVCIAPDFQSVGDLLSIGMLPLLLSKKLR